MPAHLADLLAVRSQRTEAVLAYLDAVQALPDQAAPVYLGGRQPTDLYVPVDILVREPKEAGAGGDHGRGRDRLADEDDGAFGREERGRDKEDRWRRVSWAEAWPKLHRAVVLGRPGEGKTLLLQTSARALAAREAESLREFRTSAEAVTLPVYLRLADVAAHAGAVDPWGAAVAQSAERLLLALDPLLARSLRERVIAALCDPLTLRSARCHLFLDALDEVPQPAALKAALQVLGPAECRVLVSSRPSAYDPGLLPWPAADRVECRIAPFSPEQRQDFIKRWFQRDAPAGARLLGVLHGNPRFQDLTGNALLLALTCKAAEGHELSPDLTRGELYELILRDMARGEWKPATSSPNTRPLNPHLLLRLLAHIAFIRLRADPAGNRFRADDWIDGCIQAIAKLPQDRGIDSILEQVDRVGLLVAPADGWLMFLHRSFLEYLAARHLAWRAEGERWPQFVEFVDKKAWDPHYQEVIVFLAGRLADPRPVLALLADEDRDDYFHHRLAVAAQCLPELQAAVRPLVTALIDDITERAVCVWWGHQRADAVGVVSHLKRALPALGQVNGRVMGIALMDYIWESIRGAGGGLSVGRVALELAEPAATTLKVWELIPRYLFHADRMMRTAVGRMIISLRHVAPPRALQEAIVTRLGDADPDMRETTARAVRWMRQVAATPPILAALAARLDDADKAVRRAAVEAVGALGPAAATPPILAALAARLDDADKAMRRAAVEAVGALGPAAATPVVLAALAARLDDADKAMRRAAVEAVGGLGSAAATEVFLAALLERLGVARWCVCETAGIKALGLAAATPAILTALAAWLGAAHEKVRRAAMEAFGALELEVGAPAILAALVAQLGATHGKMRRAALKTFRVLGPAAAPEAILATLPARLGDTHEAVRWVAVKAVRALRPAAVPEAILAALCERLNDTREAVRKGAVEAVRALRPAAVPEAILAALCERLNDTREAVRKGAVEAVEVLGPEVATTAIRAALLERLNDPVETVRRAAVWGVIALGPATVTPTFLVALLERLNDPAYSVRYAAGLAIDQVATSQGVRLFNHGGHLKAPITKWGGMGIPNWDQARRQSVRLFDGGYWQTQTIEELSRFTDPV